MKIKHFKYFKKNLTLKRFAKAIEKDNIKNYERCWQPCNIYVYGTPGTGKSYFGDIMFKNMNVYHKMPCSKWFDGYDKHEVVIFEVILYSVIQIYQS